jgi:hypothetical protein
MMPDPADPPPMTPHEKREWRAEFESMGREAVRGWAPNIRPQSKRQLAVKWLREQEKGDEFRTQWSFEIAVAGIVISCLARLVAVIALHK